jgi:hypothetical protein
MEKESGTYFYAPKIVFLNGSMGRFDDMLENLIRCDIIDEKLNWIFGDGHAVITGNCLDGSEESVRLLWLIYSLESKAIRKGGYLHFLPGPMDITHSSGNWRLQQPVYAPKKAHSVNKYAVLFDGNNELFRWLHTKNTLEKIGNVTVLQSNIQNGLEDFLPSFRGRRFPEVAREMLKVPLNAITEEQMQSLHQYFGTTWLIIVDAAAGMVKISVKDLPEANMDTLPLLFSNGRYHHMQENPAKVS